jgi:hypothetical protein
VRIDPEHVFARLLLEHPRRAANSQRARECPSPGTAAACSGTVRAQIAELTELLASARRDRSLDLVLLTEHEMISVSGAVLAVCSSSAKSSQATTIARTRRKSVR